MRSLTIAALAILCAAPAVAQIPVKPFSMQRVGVTLAAGMEQHGVASGEALGRGHDFYGLGGLTYSTGRSISFSGTATVMPASDLTICEAGVRSLVVGDGTGQFTQLALGAGGVWYEGDGNHAFEDKSSLNAGIYASYNLAGAPGKAVRWYIHGAGIRDWKNDDTRLRADLRLVGIPSLFQPDR